MALRKGWKSQAKYIRLILLWLGLIVGLPRRKESERLRAILHINQVLNCYLFGVFVFFQKYQIVGRLDGQSILLAPLSNGISSSAGLSLGVNGPQSMDVILEPLGVLLTLNFLLVVGRIRVVGLELAVGKDHLVVARKLLLVLLE